MGTMIVIGAALALAAVIVHWLGIYLPTNRTEALTSRWPDREV